ncbi:MAG: type I 3-dehydroquinate dehydratase [Thermoprotei archaeon]
MVARPKVVISVPVRDPSQLVGLSALEDRRADLVELRLDYLRSPSQLNDSLLQDLLAHRDRVLVTVRDPREGGKLSVDDELKSSFLKAAKDMGFSYDVELSFLKRREDVPPGRVVSKHCLGELPSIADLREEFGPFNESIRKLAVTPVGSYRSLLLSFLEEFPGSAVMSLGGDWRERIALSLLGSSLLYVHAGEPTAPGQVSADKVWALLSQFDSGRPSFFLRP